ncbi:MAG: polyphenol oxidase family protein [Acidimicrobiia bacterium]|nr:polyphenol oxidase family protein [Acidimicrobiia bacterium]MDH4307361.1 polyphenol oxidase family protein [Acidimicrobiia bacterium]MDH5294695.1 polyphenol oxidase family protein [Acidimicrobiia bacterium]
MIRPAPGVAFTLAADGDMRSDEAARARAASLLGIAVEWGTVDQVHGSDVVEVTAAGAAGRADAIYTTHPGLPLAVFTADCAGVVIVADGAVGVAHAGWRGAEAGVVSALVEAMARTGFEPHAAYVGPHIRACCFEVGPEVLTRFPSVAQTKTTWGTDSLDLVPVISGQIGVIPVELVGSCTRCTAGHHSHRADATADRMAAIGWIPASRPG